MVSSHDYISPWRLRNAQIRREELEQLMNREALEIWAQILNYLESPAFFGLVLLICVTIIIVKARK